LSLKISRTALKLAELAALMGFGAGLGIMERRLLVREEARR